MLPGSCSLAREVSPRPEGKGKWDVFRYFPGEEDPTRMPCRQFLRQGAKREGNACRICGTHRG